MSSWLVSKNSQMNQNDAVPLCAELNTVIRSISK